MPIGERRTRRAGGTRRLEVLDAVMDVLGERGYEGTRFADISGASGVAVSTLQNYFGSREDMLIEAMRRSVDREVAALEAVAAARSDPWPRLLALVDRSLANTEGTLRTLIEFWRTGIRDEEVREYSAELQVRYREPFLRAMEEGREAGTFTPEHTPVEIADFLMAALAGVMIPRVLHHETPTAEGFRSVLVSQLRGALGTRG
ncbi:TetR/AcrR family transcriptional regulator [Streptomyces fuscigenes]|uniref:TetR/AcrR family transcriptional regulator n=1 Tax=Streptomyces fuscigenes TaxID=1528880 RepID=UPI001F47441C|nr:TetR/AcrR family transcriptional regulator [Streptomyces fuscigenes]MCF3961093.1 TetR/AcrR family transcriptional regulator [Streptomyces fuscigenes]